MERTRIDDARVIAGVPRRTAVQGLAGLAAALGIAASQGGTEAKNKGRNKHKHKTRNHNTGGANAEKKKGKSKKSTSGILARTEFVAMVESVPASGTKTAEVICSKPGAKEVVVVLSGGFTLSNPELQILEAGPDDSAPSYFATARNNDAVNAYSLIARANCGYFRK